jgi:hypothetical protein
LKRTIKGQKLYDGGLLDGKNSLIDGIIDQLQSYYGIALRDKTSVEDMRRAIWAIDFHKLSTDDTSCHGLFLLVQTHGVNSKNWNWVL